MVVAFFVVLFLVLALLTNNNNHPSHFDWSAYSTTSSSSINERNGEDYLAHLLASLAQQDQKCLDSDDPLEWRTEFAISEHACHCTNPTVPVERGTTRWTDFHQSLVTKSAALVLNNDVDDKTTMSTLDVLLVGDSLTERWMGTKFLAKVQAPEFRHVFEQYFDKSKSSTATLQGAPFGGSGDTSTELLWHLQNGVLGENIQPRAVLLLIGTNDLGRVGCSKKNSLAGILNVAQYIHRQRPRAIMLVHGLLPRNEVFGDGNYTTGVKWQKIQWINRELQRYCHGQPGNQWFYLDHSQLFLRRDDASQINATLMEDALHPTVEGYQLWAPLLVEEINTVLKEQQR